MPGSLAFGLDVWCRDPYDRNTVRMLNVIEEHSRRCLMVLCLRRWSNAKVLDALTDMMVTKGVPRQPRLSRASCYYQRSFAGIVLVSSAMMRSHGFNSIVADGANGAPLSKSVPGP